MSASSKKKLRSAEQAAKMTERQLAEQKEAKKLKLYTTVFVVVLVALLAIAIGFGINNVISGNGAKERNTVAVTAGTHEISNAEMNYYFIDELWNMYSGEYGYLMQLGLLDTTQPLSAQSCVFGDGTQTWADYLLQQATGNIQAIYAMVDAANAAGYTMPQKYQDAVTSTMDSMKIQALSNGYPDLDTYLKAQYGNGAAEDSYRSYMESRVLAQAYYYEYANNLTFEDADLRALESEDYNAFTSYDYNYYFVTASKFNQGGVEGEDGTVTYSDEEIAAGIAAAEEAAKALTSDEITSVEAFDNAISQLSINAESETAVTSTVYEDLLYTGITVAPIAEWLSEGNHVAGEKAYFPSETTTDGVTTVTGYYVIYLADVDENLREVYSVRHILASFQGGTADETTGETVYSDEEKAAALTEAEALLAEWKAGEATEASFAELANLKSSDGDGTTGGLYKYVGLNTGFVEPFENWAADEARQVGDTEIVESVYGYHVMYFVGNSGRTYRDVLIESTLAATAVSDWQAELIAATPITEGDTSYVLTNLVLSAGY